MQYVLTQAVRVSAGLAYAAGAAGFIWALGIDYQPAPHTGVLICVWAAAGFAVVRAVLLWVRRMHGRRPPRPAPAGVSLEKGSCAVRRQGWDLFDAVPDGSEGWAKVRRLAVNFLILAASMTAVTLPSLPERDSVTATLQRAGAEVANASVVEQPRVIRKRYDDDDRDLVVGYVVEMVVSVPHGPARLSLARVERSELPRVGERMSVLWSRGDPSLGGITGTASELHRLADTQWKVNLMGGNVWAGVALVFGLCMLPWVFLFALGLEGDTLQELAWSPGAQWVHALIILCAAYGYTPALTGHSAHGLQALFQAGGWLLLAGMLFSPAYQLVKENRS
ncbi:hypothetical protein AB8O64_01180 [Streptomyces sp. QH1-20]|uniref:hypothetical protein n=1 Tax=Streptomyces sp. QH1-20 TaxID=3240934 RepID=UPI003512B8FA